MKLSILYRGPLSSCNYRCGYCPFAKRRDPKDVLAADRAALERFATWVAGCSRARLAILFTPWGEALVRPWYRAALQRLSHVEHVEKVAIQTNLSGGLAWLDGCDRERLALWCTYHPAEVSRARFVAKCRELHRRGVRYSVGMVGIKEHFDEISALREELPGGAYLWINAFKAHSRYYQEEDVRRLEQVDPLFRINLADYPSAGKPCNAGESVIAVDGDGTVRRCNFIRTPLANLYEPGWEAALQPRACTNAICRCHTGYVHMPALGLDAVFGDGLLERVPLATSR